MIDRSKEAKLIERLGRAAQLLQDAADIIWMATRDPEPWPDNTDWKSCAMAARHTTEGNSRFLADVADEINNIRLEKQSEKKERPPEVCGCPYNSCICFPEEE